MHLNLRNILYRGGNMSKLLWLSSHKPSSCFRLHPEAHTGIRKHGGAALGGWDEPPPSANEQVRKTAAAVDYTVSCRATNPALVIHPVPCADLPTNGQKPMTHFPLAVLLVSFASSGVVQQLDWRPPLAVLFNYTNACWDSCQGLSFHGGFLILQMCRKPAAWSQRTAAQG